MRRKTSVTLSGFRTHKFDTHKFARAAHPEGCVAPAASCSCRCASWSPPANDARPRVWRHENTAARHPVDGNDETTTIILRQEERATLTLNKISVSVCLLAIWQNGQSSSSEASWVAIGVVGFGLFISRNRQNQWRTGRDGTKDNQSLTERIDPRSTGGKYRRRF